MNRRLMFTAALAFATTVIAFAAEAAEVKNIVIVHGALADGSGWRRATDILEKRGFNVTIVQQPITSLEDDVAATKRVRAATRTDPARRPQLWRHGYHRSGQ